VTWVNLLITGPNNIYPSFLVCDLYVYFFVTSTVFLVIVCFLFDLV